MNELKKKLPPKGWKKGNPLQFDNQLNARVNKFHLYLKTVT